MRRSTRGAIAAASAVAVAVAISWLVSSDGVVGGGRRRVPVASAPLGGLALPSEWTPPPIAEGPVANLVLMVGDGMGIGSLAAARLRAFGVDGTFLLERLPVTGLVSVEPLGGVVPKSDAAATALSTGVRTENGRIALTPDGVAHRTLLEAARDAGHATGLVTTSEIFDATPAAFAAHVRRRRDFAAILDQMTTSGTDLLLGGGLETFGGADGERLTAARKRGVVVATDPDGLGRAAGLPLWGIFPGSTLGEAPTHPTVGELAAVALDRLSAEGDRRGTGFFLLIEEEGMDTAGHARDLDRLAGAALRFDGAVERVARFAAARGDTLVVVVGDHATGGVVVDESSTADRLRVVWANARHTGEPVPLYAYGPAQAALGFTGRRDNAAVGRLLASSLGLEIGAAEAVR
ncbi:MAG: alkaline phosphatase [Holophagales bacterium]|nr:alkaline phosphatase [Holophagales bacterium]